VIGIILVALALGYLSDELTFLAGGVALQVGDVFVLLAILSLAFSGTALIAQLVESLTARFSRLPAVVKIEPVYGFGTLLAVGVGATLGSPLFILIPLNIEQYEVISLASLLLATILSVAMAKVYADMYTESRRLGLEGVGGPSFVRLAAGKRSARYFISRLSMWVANTALAAYTKIVFIIFDFDFMPQILAGLGFSPESATLTVYVIAAGFIGWTILNILFEQRYLRMLGTIQVILAGVLVLLLAYHSAALGNAGGWNLTGILTLSSGYSWVYALVINTGYLYLLFFGFQEIQALERDAVERSAIPVVSWLKKGFTVERSTYLGVAMVLSVVIASALNIAYGLAVYASHPATEVLYHSEIPALYLAKSSLGPGQELLVGVAFLVAAVTTFVPAFLAATRHLSALGEDGYMPRSLAKLSWVFTVIAIFILAVADMNFLVDITDFMVLMSLGVITLSAIWLKGRAGVGKKHGKALPLSVAASCFVFGGAVYFKDPSVVVFGTMAVMFAYLIFDIIELGSLGAQLFLSLFGFVCLVALGLFRHPVYTTGFMSSISQVLGEDPNTLLISGLLVASALLAMNVVVDVKVLKRTSVR
jgi:amino acid transporter